MNDSRAPGFQSKIPFLIVGSGRCGSTYLYELLELHPKIAITNESGVFNFLNFCSQYASLFIGETRTFSLEVAQELYGLIAFQCRKRFSEVFDRHILAMIEEFYANQFSDREFSLWGDKLPDPGAAIAFQELAPSTCLILLVRDPRDVVCSWFSFSRRDRVRKKFPHLEEKSASEWAQDWTTIYSQMRKYGRNLLEVRYEDLIATPRETLRSIMSHLGESVATAQVEGIGAGRHFADHSTSESPEASIQRWRRDLSASEIEVIESLCGSLMREFGYELSG